MRLEKKKKKKKKYPAVRNQNGNVIIFFLMRFKEAHSFNTVLDLFLSGTFRLQRG